MPSFPSASTLIPSKSTTLINALPEVGHGDKAKEQKKQRTQKSNRFAAEKPKSCLTSNCKAEYTGDTNGV
ncbi:SSU processome component SAS10 [Colletotrichum sp. SAR11_57]|nr:SSU processome component SAS10 [Colletotrichum sp. SAR11_57]